MPGEVIVGFAAEAGAAQRAAALAPLDLRGRERIPVEDATVLKLAPGTTVAEALAQLRGTPGVAWAEPNAVFHRMVIPDDPAFPAQWGLRNVAQVVQGQPDGQARTPGADIHAEAAWDVTVGSPAVKVAIVDGGVDTSHPDLTGNAALGLNLGEVGGGREANGIDDDKDGLVDDWRGWDFRDDDNDPADEDTMGHGTLVASVIAARGGDGIGVTGVAWYAGLIPIRAMSPNGEGDAVDVAAALTYAAARGARVVNVSLGSSTPSQVVQEAIAASPNTLFVVAAGNAGSDLDEAPTYPCAVPLQNVICVTATDQADALPSFANYGGATVHLAAPGDQILGANPGGTYHYLRGTSFAAPFVSGAAVLAFAAKPAASTAQVRAALLAGADRVAGLAGKTITGGRLNAAATLAALGAPPAGPAVQLTAAEPGAGAARLTGRVVPRGRAVAHYFEYGPTSAYGAATATRSLAPDAGPTDVAETVVAPPDEPLHYRLVAADVDGVTLGPDQVTAPIAPADPITPGSVETNPSAGPLTGRPPQDKGADRSASAGAANGAETKPAQRPRVAVRRAGGRWFLTLRLGAPGEVAGRLERRRQPTGRSAFATTYARVMGLPRRGVPAGARRISLGHLKAGAYRLTLDVRTGNGRVRIVKAFRVTAAAARV
ncbi:MAG: serine protease [Miltoncostaeaceae bacterium]|nr:serine protease [Miltoncostaeaceae bacterium]